MTPPSQIMVFGGLDYDYRNNLHLLASEPNDVLLKSFFKRVTLALQEEIKTLPSSHLSSILSDKTITEWILKKEPCFHQGLEMALTCMYQFACLIRHLANTNQPYPPVGSIHVVGICTGLLTGAALSCSSSLYQLVDTAVRTVVVAFRTGLVAEDMRCRLHLSHTESAAWSVMVPGLGRADALEMISRYHDEMSVPSVAQVYVSACTPAGVILSGCPHVLEEFLEAPCMTEQSYLRTRIRAPYHARHIYDLADVDRLLDTAYPTELERQLSRLGMDTGFVSNRPGEEDLRGLVRRAVIGILLEPVRLDKIIEHITRDIAGSSRDKITIIPIGSVSSSGIANAITKIARCKVLVDTSIQDPQISRQTVASSAGHPGKPKLAIIGYSGRYADANSNDEFWSLLYEGRDASRTAPLQRWDVRSHVDPTLKRKNTSATPYGCWLKDADLFDAPFFGMSPREAPQVDPAQRLALMTTYEAMEVAGMVADLTPSTKRSRVGVFFGMTSNDWSETNASQDIDTYYIPGSCRAFVPGRQNYFHKFSGPSYCVDTACSSSLAAMHLACNALWQEDIDTAICGGTNVMTNPDITAGLDRGFFLSRTGNCKTFDEEADGYCRGEGVVTMIIKRLDDAIADNDPIQAIILGAYTNHSAEAESITRPHIGAQKAIFEYVLASSGVDPQTVSYIEMHGTGTQAGDAREMESVLSTFAPSVPPLPESRKQPLYIGSVKGNIGHGESVSGITALAKVLMMMKENTIPPHCGIKTRLNSKFPADLNDRMVHIALDATAWPREAGKSRRAFINNFSAAGGNSSILIEDAPAPGFDENVVDPRTAHVVAVSAKTPVALLANIRDMIAYLDAETPEFASLSYTTTARRTHHRYRVMACGSTLKDISLHLKDRLTAASSTGLKPCFQSSAAFAFTGQGAQYPGMARELFRFESLQQDVRTLDSLVQKQGFPSIMPFIDHEDKGSNVTVQDFNPLIVQLASVCVQVAVARLWRSWGVKPEIVIGHSLGEYAALNAAGVISDADTIYLVGTRARIMEQKCARGSHSMLAVTAPLDMIRRCAGEFGVEIACRNGPNDTVLSGPDEPINLLAGALHDAGVRRVKKMNVPYAFHSSQMECILDELEQAATKVTYYAPHTPVLSPLLCKVVTSAGVFNAGYLRRQCRSTVDFAGVLENARASNLIKDSMVWIEIGPQPVTIGLLKSNIPSIVGVPTVQHKHDTWKVLSSSLRVLYESGHNLQWKQYHSSFEKGLHVLRLPTYNWDLKSYWLPYVNDWSLYKGDAGFLLERQDDKPSTTCVHRIVEETTADDILTVVSECDLLRADLKPVSHGHSLNGVSLCTPSIYAEIAFVLGDYLHQQRLSDQRLVKVQSMNVQRPLVLQTRSKVPKLLRCRLVFDSKTGKADAQFYSVTVDGIYQEQHAECSVVFPAALQAIQEAKVSSGLILQAMEGIREKVISDSHVQKLSGSTGYQLVSSLATYNDEYKGVAEIIMDSSTLTAAIKVKCCSPANEGIYCVNPFLIDSFGQPALFVMNANDHTDLDKEVFVNHGWDSMEFFQRVDAEKTYEVYVDMSKTLAEGIQTGNSYVFDDRQLVALIRGIKAQKVPRRLLNYITHMRDDSKEIPSVPSSKPVNGALNGVTSPLPTWDAALTIIMEESGCSMCDLEEDTCFADLGVDSMLSLLCASRFREELGVKYEAIIFEEHPTVSELRQFWEQQLTGAGPKNQSCNGDNSDALPHSRFDSDSSISATPTSIATPATNLTSSTGKDTPQANDEQSDPCTVKESGAREAYATSLLLQGNPSFPETRKTLFLLPDGSGSASAYRHLPFIDETLAIIALNCPFRKQPSSYTGGVDTASYAYVAQIRHRQPCGPYALGGWSVGGIFTYRVAQILTQQGEQVSDLVLIDCPVPRGLDYLPKRYFEYCNRIGLFGTVHGYKDAEGPKVPPPAWLIPHFEACIDSLHDYYATPWKPGLGAPVPTTHVIWACEPIDFSAEEKFEHMDGDPEGLNFLTRARTDFGPCGWETLLPVECMRFWSVGGASHFSMMRGECAGVLAGIIKEALVC
ncbi:beta-ketoacyl synthase [Aspergillus granulosus]|uniref:Beta-ketoacyl synthase n=1 Tax=Aspergillus granulosus TaxID=176169 RepID=A0ABR4HEQ4_9EURO